MKKIKATIMKLDTPNSAGRIYSSEKFNETIKEYLSNENKFGTIQGELDHPVQMKEISHSIDNIEIDENNNVIGEFTILDTSKGHTVQTLLENDIKLAMAPRMMIDADGNYKLISVDVIPNDQKTFDNASIDIINN